MIKPTIGRVVWFYVHSLNGGHKGPLAAIVTKVHSDQIVNLAAFGEDGGNRPQACVRLIQAEEEAPQSDYCSWMPYQLGQAAKTEAVLAGAKK